ncbi:hypothetical protein ABPG74_007533 [Tetrahymena malaccensis]
MKQKLKITDSKGQDSQNILAGDNHQSLISKTIQKSSLIKKNQTDPQQRPQKQNENQNSLSQIKYCNNISLNSQKQRDIQQVEHNIKKVESKKNQIQEDILNKQTISEEQKKNQTQNCIAECQQNKFTLNYKFFDVISNSLLEKIYLFLDLKDYVKLATVCHRTRNIIPKVIKLQDYSQFVKDEDQELYSKTDFQNMCESFLYIQENFQKLMKDQFILEINQQLKEFNKKKIIGKEVLLDILVAAVNYFMQKNIKKNEVVDYILQKGVKNIFKPLNLNYVKPSNTNNTLLKLLRSTLFKAKQQDYGRTDKIRCQLNC